MHVHSHHPMLSVLPTRRTRLRIVIRPTNGPAVQPGGLDAADDTRHATAMHETRVKILFLFCATPNRQVPRRRPQMAVFSRCTAGVNSGRLPALCRLPDERGLPIGILSLRTRSASITSLFFFISYVRRPKLICIMCVAAGCHSSTNTYPVST